MGYCNTQELYSFLTTAEDHKVSAWSQQVVGYTRAPVSFAPYGWADKRAVTMEGVEEFLKNYHEQLCDGRFISWKGFRPWNVIDLTSNLDASKAWIGWEVETGWKEEEYRDEAVRTFFDTYEHVCIDNEGGRYGVEFTWTPKEVGAYEEKDHPLMFMPKFNRRTEEHDPSDEIGTHINISTPTLRAMSESGVCVVSSSLNRMLREFEHDQKERLFGRPRLYGGFYVRGNVSNEDSGAGHWLEGKLFNSTYSVPVAREYIAVGNRLAVLVEAVAAEAVRISSEADAKVSMASIIITNGYECLRKDGVAPSLTSTLLAYRAPIVDFYDEEEGDSWHGDYEEEEDDDAELGVWCDGCGEYH